MGVVYQAHDPRLDRRVAIKFLPPDLTRDETAKQRFLQEAKAASHHRYKLTWEVVPRRFVRVVVLALLIRGLAAPAAVLAQAESQFPPLGNASVAVMPFSNITGDPNDAWIGAGIAETLMADLQRSHGFTVIDPEFVTEAMNAMGLTARASNGEAALLAVARRVGAQRMITGGYQRLGDQIRITGRLVEVQTGLVARAAKVDGALGELFGLQDQIVGELVNGTSAMADLTPEPAPVPPLAVSTVAEPEPSSVVPVESPSTSAAGTVATLSAMNTGGAALLAMIDGPPPPMAPEVMSRDGAGRATIRAIKLTEGIRLDGRLDEEVYLTVPPVTDFIQQVPVEGAPATEKTEVWIMFDQRNLYVSGRVWDSAPSSEWVANELRRDSQLMENDNFGVVFDTFYDHRNGFFFYTTPLGALADQQIANQGNPNLDWNPVWDVRTGRFEGGWTVEMEIPFKSLRYRSAPTQLWGVQFRRVIRRKNEFVYLTPVPISLGPPGVYRVSRAATLVGLQVPGTGLNLEIKPYGIGGVRTDLDAEPPQRNDGTGDFGVDVKYGVTRSLTADLTYNTDFAQVEVDEQQIDLTRFSLFFPEKREFFLEGRGIFNFARGGIGRGPGGGGSRRRGDVPTLFFSRRIGLQDGAVVPILGGGRMTGKVGAFDVGALTIQTDDLGTEVESANFTAVRLRRDILRRSSIGAIFTNRSVSLVGDGSNQAYGVDGVFSFYDNVEFVTYVAKTETPGLRERDLSYQGRFRYNGDRYGLTADHLVVEDNFTPEVGFVRRDNFRRTNLSGRFSPRPRSIEWVRQFTVEGRVDYFLTADTGRLETRLRVARFDTEFENSDRFGVSFTNSYELLEEPFEIAPNVTIPVGGYGFSDIEASYALGAQRRASGRFSVRIGSFWSGDIKTVGYTRGRVAILEQFSVEPSVSVNWIDLPEGSFRTELARLRLNYSFTPRMFFSGLVQYNSSGDSLSTNLRLRWEYTPGSELFVVYTNDRDTDPLLPNRFAELRNRGFVVKVTRLFRF